MTAEELVGRMVEAVKIAREPDKVLVQIKLTEEGFWLNARALHPCDNQVRDRTALLSYEDVSQSRTNVLAEMVRTVRSEVEELIRK